MVIFVNCIYKAYSLQVCEKQGNYYCICTAYISLPFLNILHTCLSCATYGFHVLISSMLFMQQNFIFN